MWLGSYFLMKLLDISHKRDVLSNYRRFSRYLSAQRIEILEYQRERLKNLVLHATSSVPYYIKNLDKGNNYSLNIAHPTEILKRFPIIDRDIIQLHQEDLISSKFKVNELIRGSSSGTTGIPIEYYCNKGSLSAGLAAGYILLGMSGWKLGQRNVHIWGNQSSIKRWNTLASRAKNWLINQKNIASTLLDDPSEVEEIARNLIKFNPISIEGYSSSIYSLAEYFKAEDLIIKSLKQVITTAENLEDYQKRLIEEVFAPVGDLYGSGEILGIASRPAGDDKYYIFDPHVIVESVDSVLPGMKDVLITDLDNYGMPLIRYKIGDMIDEIHEPSPDSKYPLRWFKKIYGRRSDIITLPNGMKFHPVNIFGGTLFRKFPEITRHKVIWDGSTLKFIFETRSFKKSVTLENVLTKTLGPYQVDFSIVYTDKIPPGGNGKYNYMEIKDKVGDNK